MFGNREGKRPLGKRGRRCEVNGNMYACVKGRGCRSSLGQDRVQRRSWMNTVTNVQIPLKARNALSKQASRRFHEGLRLGSDIIKREGKLVSAIRT